MTHAWGGNASNVTIAGYPRTISDQTLAAWLGVSIDRVKDARARIKPVTRKAGRPFNTVPEPISSHGERENGALARNGLAECARALLRRQLATGQCDWKGEALDIARRRWL